MELIPRDSEVWNDEGVVPLTKEQAIICAIITGMVFLPMRHVRNDVSRRLGREVKLVEFANPDFRAEIQQLYRDDFLKVVINDPIIELR